MQRFPGKRQTAQMRQHADAVGLMDTVGVTGGRALHTFGAAQGLQQPAPPAAVNAGEAQHNGIRAILRHPALGGEQVFGRRVLRLAFTGFIHPFAGLLRINAGG